MKDAPKPPETGPVEGLSRSDSLWRVGDRPLTLQDTNEIQLLLRGQSVVDWHRLAYTSEDEVKRLLALNCIDIDDPADCERFQDLRAQAVRYIAEVLNLRIDKYVASEIAPLQLPLLASRKPNARQRQACTLLKVMHVLYHLEARERRTTLAISESDIYARVEENVALMFDELRAAGVPVVEFSWSRKTRNSLITKLLLKRETSAARVFDRLRFRLIVEAPDDLVPTLHIMLRRCVPFNYVVPEQTVNSLLDLERMTALPRGDENFEAGEGDPRQAGNEFSGEDYRILNFVADLPVRLGSVLPPAEVSEDDRRRVVFVLAEFQIMDRQTAVHNEAGERSHSHYKQRQHQHVRVRLLREPRRS
ncbi:MAG: TIGR04552 family protein [Myxococcales bacterium]|nr:TIGR04552 family protein [Myxococcales bacterium]